MEDSELVGLDDEVERVIKHRWEGLSIHVTNKIMPISMRKVGEATISIAWGKCRLRNRLSS